MPLLLAGRVGPGKTSSNCMRTSNATHWSCCTDTSKPCRANVLDQPAAEWTWNQSISSFLPEKPCAGGLSNSCCKVEPWAEGEAYHYPYRVSEKGEYLFPAFVSMWPYGGGGYILSRAMLDTIGADHWKKCMHALQCANADHRVMTCVLNAGFSVSYVGGIPTMQHHIKA